MINQELILLPALALVLLAFLVAVATALARISEMRVRRIRPQQMATRAGTTSVLKSAAAVSDNFMNLFEMPVLFYFLITLLYAAGLADMGYLTLAVVYVVLRYAHTLVHATYNRVMHRFYVYVLSTIVLGAMWVRFGWQLVELLRLNDHV